MVALFTTMFKTKVLHFVDRVHLCGVHGSRNKQRLFPHAAFTNYFRNRDKTRLQRGTHCVLTHNTGYYYPHSLKG